MVFTTETRLSEQTCHNIIAYARAYVHDYCIIQRYVWHYIVRNKGIPNGSAFNTIIQRKYNVSKRTANSVINDMLGRYRALAELKETERFQMQQQIGSLKEKIGKLKESVNKTKELATTNKLTGQQLVSYRRNKKSLFL